MTELQFNEDSYLDKCEATITSIDNNIIQLDRTIFYAESGGQPGDIGEIVLNDRELKGIDTQKGSSPKEIQHIIEGEIDQYLIGKSCELRIDWERRKDHMRLHTSCHILCSLVDAMVSCVTPLETLE